MEMDRLYSCDPYRRIFLPLIFIKLQQTCPILAPTNKPPCFSTHRDTRRTIVFSMKDDVMPPDLIDASARETDTTKDINGIMDLQQARVLVEKLSRSLETSNKLVHALLDGSANDKVIGKYILKTARQTDALIEQRACKKLEALLEKAILCKN